MRDRLTSGMAVMVCAHAAHAAPTPGFSFTLLGDLPGGAFRSTVNGLSRDGTTVVGGSNSANGPEAFIWTADSGMVALGDLPGGAFASSAGAVSANGSEVVGLGQLGLGGNSVTNRAFRWTAVSGLVDLGSIPPTNGFSNPWGISGDGRWVSGTAQAPSGFDGFIWDRETGVMQSIGAFEARSISDDGAVVSTIQSLPDPSGAGSNLVASRWTSETGHVPIGLLRPTDSLSDPRAMTPDGSVIVGWSAPTPGGTPTNQRAFIWTQADGMTALPSINPGQPNWISEATSIAADGSIIGGFERVAGDNEQFAVIWDRAGHAINLQLFLESNGIEFEGYELLSVTGVSGDGRTVAGTAIDPLGQLQGFIATIPAPGLAPWAGLLVIGVSRRRR